MHPPERSPDAPRVPEPLTATEITVLRMLDAGRPAVAAAHATGLTLGFVARTAGALRSRYRTPSTVRALASARDEGLI